MQNGKAETWNERTANDLDNQNAYPHQFLTDYFGQCIYGGDPNDASVLVPFCGKSIGDVKWLYDEGYRLYGVDESEKILKTFFDDFGIKCTYVPAISGGFSMFKSPDDRIKLFCGDFFRLSKNVTGCCFDVVWDRNAFMTIDVQCRERYIDVIREMLLPTGRILLSTFLYDTSKWRGPPYPMRSEDIRRYFNHDFHVNKLKSRNALQNWQLEKWGIDWLKESGYMLSMKT